MSILKSIAQLQREAEEAVAAIGQIPAGMLPPQLEGLRQLFPSDGFHAVVSLRSASDRQIKRNADASNWDPTTGVVEVRFAPNAPAAVPSLVATESEGYDDETAVSAGGHVASRVGDVVLALDAAEREPRFREFVGIKQFRDLYLPNCGLAWAAEPAERHRALVLAIDQGVISKGSVVNPRFPVFPTTTVRVNRDHPAVQQLLQSKATERSAFRPISVGGEPLSQTVIDGRR